MIPYLQNLYENRGFYMKKRKNIKKQLQMLSNCF